MPDPSAARKRFLRVVLIELRPNAGVAPLLR
jgi:hypothetical protein